jgi:two-component system, response regulator PdtaR
MLLRRPARTIRRLLVVEDEPLVAFDNEYFLVQDGYAVVATVDNVTEALALLDPDKIDAVLLDVNLAGERSGVEVARAARAVGVPVLFLTGSLPEGAADLAMAALAKPYGHRDLSAALKAMDAMVAGRAPGKVPEAVRLFA